MLSNRVRGGRKTAATLKAKDPDYYRKIGALGGRNGGSPKGLFAHGKVSPSEAGIKGGRNGKRGPALFVEDDSEFGDGLLEPTWKDRMLTKIRRQDGQDVDA